MERLSDKSYGKNVINIGPNEQRFGAWARVLPANEQMKFCINASFLESCKNKSLLVRITYLDQKDKDFKVVINNIAHSIKAEGENKWITKQIEIKDGS